MPGLGEKKRRQDVAARFFAQYKTVPLHSPSPLGCHQTASEALLERRFTDWSGRRGSNPRQPAWKAGTLPLSYSRKLTFSFIGRGAQTRTADLLLPKQARYQLRHTPQH